MGFTVKAVKAARTKRDTAKGPLLRQQQNIPAVKAGPNNSKPTKAGAKRSVKPNRNSSNGESRKKSTRLNYSMLRKMGK